LKIKKKGSETEAKPDETNVERKYSKEDSNSPQDIGISESHAVKSFYPETKHRDNLPPDNNKQVSEEREVRGLEEMKDIEDYTEEARNIINIDDGKKLDGVKDSKKDIESESLKKVIRKDEKVEFGIKAITKEEAHKEPEVKKNLAAKKNTTEETKKETEVIKKDINKESKTTPKVSEENKNTDTTKNKTEREEGERRLDEINKKEASRNEKQDPSKMEVKEHKQENETHRNERSRDANKHRYTHSHEKKHSNERHKRSHEDIKSDYKKNYDNKHHKDHGKHKDEKTVEKKKTVEPKYKEQEGDEDSDSIWNEDLVPNKYKRQKVEETIIGGGRLDFIKKYIEENNRLMGIKNCPSDSQADQVIRDISPEKSSVEKISMVMQKGGKKVIDTKALKGEPESSPSISRNKKEDLRSKIAALTSPMKDKHMAISQ